MSMLEKADLPVIQEPRAERPIFVANKLSKVGDYVQARALLETVDLTADDTAAMLYVMVLDKMGAQAEKQAAVERLIDGLGATPKCSDTLLTFLLRQSQRNCLDNPQVETLLDAAATRQPLGDDLEMVFHAVKRRHLFKLNQSPRAANVNLISLGKTCLPWNLVNRWGLRDKAQFVHDLNPFCMATHKLRGVLDALNDNFATYMKLDDITTEGGRQPYAVRRDRSVLWNHNQGAYWTQDDYRALREVTETKIINFKRSCRDRTPVFIFTASPDHPEEVDFLPPLRQALSRFTGRANDYIIVSSKSIKAKQKGIHRIDDTGLLFYCPFPSEDYTWFAMDTADSAEGLQFERGYVRFLFECLKRWELLKPREADDSQKGKAV